MLHSWVEIVELERKFDRFDGVFAILSNSEHYGAGHNLITY